MKDTASNSGYSGGAVLTQHLPSGPLLLHGHQPTAHDFSLVGALVHTLVNGVSSETQRLPEINKKVFE